MKDESIEKSIASLQDCLERIKNSAAQPEVKGDVEEAIRTLSSLEVQVQTRIEQEHLETLRKQEEVRETFQAKTKFVSAVTHELRTPMTSIKGYTDLLRSGVVGPLKEQQLSFLNTIRNNVERMSALVSQLSDLNHMDTGRLHLENSLFPISICVSDTIHQLQPKIDEKKQIVEVDIHEDCSSVYADKNRFMQILMVLLSNANRYTPNGGCIHIRAFPEREFIRLEVEDNGIGISGKDQEQLFTAFFRSEDPAVRELPGWGLELVVMKRLVELMGGKVGVISQLQQGSTFWFTLPTKAAE